MWYELTEVQGGRLTSTVSSEGHGQTPGRLGWQSDHAR